MLVVKVLGSGCANCTKVEQVARQALEALDVEASIVKVTDYAKIMQYPIWKRCTPNSRVEGD